MAMLDLREFSLARCQLDAAAARDGWDDANRVAFAHAGLVLLQVADVFVIHIDVDEAAQAAIVGIEVLFQIAEARSEPGKGLADCGGLQFDAFLLARVGAQGSGYDDFHWHLEMPPSR